MAYLTNFHRGTTVKFSIPISSLYPSVSLEGWDKVTVVLSSVKGETPIINDDTLVDEVAGTCDIELSTSTTDEAHGSYYYEIIFLHSDTSEVSEYEEEYVIESGRVKILERV